MRLRPLYRARFETPESWGVQLSGPHGSEAQNPLFAQGRHGFGTTAADGVRRLVGAVTMSATTSATAGLR